eukprot:1693121-Pleurochrysis_carterae.AAC.1
MFDRNPPVGGWNPTLGVRFVETMHVSVKLQMKDAHDEDRTPNDRRARRQFVSKCRARARVEPRVIGSFGKTLDNRSRSRYRWISR